MSLLDTISIIEDSSSLQMPKSFKQLPPLYDVIKREIENTVGLFNPDHLNKTKSHIEFYSSNPILDAYFSDLSLPVNAAVFKKEFFYSLISGIYIDTIPAEIVAILHFALQKYKTPNKSLVALDKSRFNVCLKNRYHTDGGYIKKALDLLCGYNTELVSTNKCVVTNKDTVEIYISNIDDILMCSTSIRSVLTHPDDYTNLYYDSERGIVLGENRIALRTILHPYGIAKNDLDLRKVGSEFG